MACGWGDCTAKAVAHISVAPPPDFIRTPDSPVLVLTADVCDEHTVDTAVAVLLAMQERVRDWRAAHP